MGNLIKRFSTKVLLAAERFYLNAHGWIQIAPDTWDSPIDYPFKKRMGVRQGHAVNSQKQDMHNEIRDTGRPQRTWADKSASEGN